MTVLSNPDPLVFGGMVVLLGAVVLSLLGMGLILYGARMTRHAISRRVDLLRPAGAVAFAPRAATFIRTGPHGSQAGERAEMARLLAKLGIHADKAAATLLGARLFALAAIGGLGYLAGERFLPASDSLPVPLLAAMVFGIGGWFIPGWLIGKALKARTKAIVDGLPDALELLVICVEAGLSFEDGIDRIVVGLRQAQPALADELALTSADLKILPSREMALANLAERVDMPSVHSVATTLSQTLRYGTPLAQALRMVAEELRNDSIIRLEERANQLPTLMTIPMMLFIMPTIFLVVAGPAVLKVMDIFK
jgi:tight adherence protein C